MAYLISGQPEVAKEGALPRVPQHHAPVPGYAQ